MHCKPNPLENGKRSGQWLNSTRCRCDAHHQHWNLWRDTNHNLHHSLTFMREIGLNTHYDQIWTHKHPKSDSYIFYTCMRNQCHFKPFCLLSIMLQYNGEGNCCSRSLNEKQLPEIPECQIVSSWISTVFLAWRTHIGFYCSGNIWLGLTYRLARSLTNTIWTYSDACSISKTILQRCFSCERGSNCHLSEEHITFDYSWVTT